MIFACYAVYLLAGNTLKGTSISATTLKLYLNAAGANKIFLSKSRNYNDYNSQLALTSGYPPMTNNIVKEHFRWMKVPNRREPVTKNMIQFWITKNLLIAHEDSLEAALTDWMIVGAKTGFRKSEWCQDQADSKKGNLQKNVDGTVKAFISSDWNFSTAGKIKSRTPCTSRGNNVLKITWRYQKNGQNGETIPYVKDSREPNFCPVQAALRIMHRANRLGVAYDEPIAVFSTTKCKKCFIHNNHVRTFLQEAAQAVYNIKDQKILNLFTCHFIRVGA